MQSELQINLYSFYKSRSKTYLQPDLEITLYSSYKSQINLAHDAFGYKPHLVYCLPTY